MNHTQETRERHFRGQEAGYDDQVKIGLDTSKKGQIERRLNELSRLIDVCHESFSELHSRLNPVLNEVPETDSNKGAAVSQSMSPLAYSLDEYIERLVKLNRRINYIKEVIDL